MVGEKESNITFEKVYESAFVPSDPEIKKANVLLLPYKNFREGVEYCFTEYATEFFQYLVANTNEEIIADIAIRDEQYYVIEMHALLLDIGMFIASNVVVSAVVNILSNFIYDKIRSLHEKEENVNVRVEIIVQNGNGTSKSIRYDGTASGFEEIKGTVEKIVENDGH